MLHDPTQGESPEADEGEGTPVQVFLEPGITAAPIIPAGQALEPHTILLSDVPKDLLHARQVLPVMPSLEPPKSSSWCLPVVRVAAPGDCPTPVYLGVQLPKAESLTMGMGEGKLVVA